MVFAPQAPGVAVPGCPFCEPPRATLVEDDLVLAFADAYPVSSGHTLVVPLRHVETYFDCTGQERAASWAMWSALQEEAKALIGLPNRRMRRSTMIGTHTLANVQQPVLALPEDYDMPDPEDMGSDEDPTEPNEDEDSDEDDADEDDADDVWDEPDYFSDPDRGDMGGD